MTQSIKLCVVVIAVIAVCIAGAVASAQRGEPAQTPKPAAAPVVTIIGCVDRLPAATPTANPAPAPVYKIIDVQHGGGSAGRQGVVLAAEYMLTGPASLEFGKFQNQWVELTGSITPVPPVTTSAGSGRGRAGSPPPAFATFNATALKMVSTECK